MTTVIRRFAVRSSLLTLTLTSLNAPFTAAQASLPLSDLPGLRSPEFHTRPEILDSAGIPDLPITNYTLQPDADLSDVLKHHGITPSAEAYSMIKHLNPDLPLYIDPAFPSGTELRLPTTDVPVWQSLLRGRELRIIDTELRHALNIWSDPALTSAPPSSADSIPATNPPGVLNPYYVAHDGLLSRYTGKLPNLPLDDHLFRPDDTLAALLASRRIAPSYEAYAMLRALNPEIIEWSHPALTSRQLRIPSAANAEWIQLLGDTTLWIREPNRFRFAPASQPRDFLTHALAIDHYSQILPVGAPSFADAGQALQIINARRDSLVAPIEAHLFHATQQLEFNLALLVTMSYASDGLLVDLPEDFRQATIATANDYMASLIATASALENNLPTCHHLVVPTPNKGIDIHDLRVYWISRGDHRYGSWEERTRFNYNSSPADTCHCNVPLGYAVVYAEDIEGNLVSRYDERDLTLPPNTTPTSFVLDVTHESPGSPVAQCPNA